MSQDLVLTKLHNYSLYYNDDHLDDINTLLVDHVYPLFISLHSQDAYSDDKVRATHYDEALQMLRAFYEIIINNKEVRGIFFCLTQIGEGSQRIIIRRI
jgi:hypothetical protein